MAGLKALLKPSRILRQRALYRGLMGGDRFWMGIGAAMWLFKTLRKLFSGGEPSARYIEEIKPGERLVITHPDAEPRSRRGRRRSA